MSTKMLVTMKLDQRLAMNQQLRQAITLLQYTTLELKQVVKLHIESNPLIDIEEIESVEEAENVPFDAQQYTADLSKRNNYQYDDSTLENLTKQNNLREHLLEQTLLCHFNIEEQIIAEAIIDAIDDNGYLTMPLDEIRQTLSLPKDSAEIIHSVLEKIQTFDPAGIGARNIRECLLLQLEAYQPKTPAWDAVYHLVSQFHETITLDDIKQARKELKFSHPDHHESMMIFRMLNLYPGSQYAADVDIRIEPELYAKKVEGEWVVCLADSVLTHIKINKQYQDLIRQSKQHTAYASIKQELDEAKWLVSGLKKRNETLLKVGSYIMHAQEEFLELGLEYMKPMNMIDVSTALELHESTVSRVTTGKYIATPRGVYELKYFFPSHVHAQNGELCSATAVKAFIKEIIAQENRNHVYSDQEIVEQLEQKGVNIARRTVAKYRESLNILSSYQRQIQWQTKAVLAPETTE